MEYRDGIKVKGDKIRMPCTHVQSDITRNSQPKRINDTSPMWSQQQLVNPGRSFINPRRACAARVTVVSVRLSICLFVCLSTTILALQATRRLMSDTNSFSATRA